MTNDTTTLNGALAELGETMADNLVTMGVTDADPSDGLTTLANKILDIAPVPPTPTPASIDLTSNKSILSYADSESASLTATVYDSSDNPLSGQTVSMKVYKASDDSLLETLTVTDVGDGTYTASYLGKGTGDLYIKAECSLLSETYSIEDCIKVGFNGWTGTVSTGTDTYDYITPTGTGVSPNVTLPSAFKVNYKFKNTNTSGSESTGSGLWNIGVDTNNGILIGHETSNKRIRVYIRTNGNNSAQTPTNNAYEYNTWTDAEITYNNGTISLSVGDKTISYSISAPSIMQFYNSYSALRIAEFKIKPL